MFLISPEYYKIKKTLTKGSGVFALKHIPAGTLIGDYLGLVVSDIEVEKRHAEANACYAFEYLNGLSIFPLDLKAIGVHLINHSCAANCSTIDHEGHNLFFALRHIFPGEELAFDYEFDSSLGGGDQPCSCGSHFCRGTMYARADKPALKKKKNNLKKKKINEKKDNFLVHKVGEVLTPLKKYPKEIKDDHTKYNIFANLETPALIDPALKLPTLKEIREIIRLSGRRLKFPKLNISILAVVDDHLVVER